MQLLTPRHTVIIIRNLSVLVLPHGGQHTARRNAWAGMVSAAARTRDRAEAEAALDAVLHQPVRQVAAGR